MQTQVERVLWGTCKNMQELAQANIKTAAFLLWKCLLSFKCLLKFLLNFLLSVLPIVPCNFYCECKLDFVKHSAIRPHSLVQWQLQISCKMKTIRVGVILQTQTSGQSVGNMILGTQKTFAKSEETSVQKSKSHQARMGSIVFVFAGVIRLRRG